MNSTDLIGSKELLTRGVSVGLSKLTIRLTEAYWNSLELLGLYRRSYQWLTPIFFKRSLSEYLGFDIFGTLIASKNTQNKIFKLQSGRTLGYEGIFTRVNKKRIRKNQN